MRSYLQLSHRHEVHKSGETERGRQERLTRLSKLDNGPPHGPSPHPCPAIQSTAPFHTTQRSMAPQNPVDESSLPAVFQAKWKSNPVPDALPFPRDNPPFALTSIDWQQLSLTDDEYTPHSWTDLKHLIEADRLDELKRWPSQLKAYLAWTAHVKREYGSSTTYLLTQRLFWKPVDDASGGIAFNVRDVVPFADPKDFAILRNDWPYGHEEGIRHICVWLKQRLPVDEHGALSDEGRRMVEELVEKEFRTKSKETERYSKVLWFKNTTNLQSVRSLEHLHVLVRNVDEEVLKQWLV